MARRKSKREYGAGSIIQDKRRGCWYYQPPPDENHQRPTRKRYATREHAELAQKSYLAEQEAKKRGGVDPRAGEMPFEAWFWFWFDNYKVPTIKETTVEYYRSRAARLLVPAFEGARLEAINGDHVILWRNQLVKNMHGREPSVMFSLLYEAMEKAVKTSKILRNPVDMDDKPKTRDGTPREALPESDFHAALDACYQPHRYLLVYLMGLCGMRPGEAQGLRWKDFDGEVLTIRGQWQRIGNTTKRLDSTKGDRGANAQSKGRPLPLPPVARDLVKAEKRRQQEQTIRAGGVWDDDALIFGGKHPQSASNYWRATLKRAKVEYKSIGSLRNTCITRLDELSVRRVVTKAIVGHSRKADVTDRYSTVSLEDVKRALEAAEAVIWGEQGKARKAE